MSTVSLPFAIPRNVTGTVRRLRWLVRAYVAVEGTATIVMLLSALFWLALAIDWLFEPVPFVRVLMWVGVIASTTWVFVRYFLVRILAPLSDSSLALLVERNYPQLKESLVTTVEAADRRRPVPLGNTAMLRQTSGAAAEGVRNVSVMRLLRWRPLATKSGIAALLVVSIAVFAMLESPTFAFWMERMRLSEQLWPRRVSLSVVGFEQQEGQRVRNVARDDNLDLEVLASIEGGHVAPGLVEIRYERADGRRGSSPMIRVGQALAGRDKAQHFRYTFQNVEQDLTFDIVGGDDRIRDLHLHVVERPQIDRIVLDCEYPAYMDRSPRSIPVSNRAEIPEGARAVCRVRATKPLSQAQVHDPVESTQIATAIESENPHEFHFEITAGKTDQVLLLTIRDTEGVESLEPYRVVVSVIPDVPPDVSVALRGIGAAVTPQAVIPLAGSVTDDYGLGQVWCEYQIDKLPPDRRDFTKQPQGSRTFDDFDRFDLAVADPQTKQRLVSVSPGQKLTLSIQANDAYDLGEPHVGASQRFLLDVVTESELRALLEKRELTLRQRFEAIYEKMVGTRELLDRIEIVAPAEETSEQSTRRHDRDYSRIGGCLQNATQLSYETIGVAEGIEEIVAELVNNRVDTEELKLRLEQGIAEPLRTIGGELLPELETRLQQLQKGFTENLETDSRLNSSKVQADEVISAMKQVLDRMLELESYNELVELLRGIVDEQKELRTRTAEERLQKLRSILDDDE